MDRNSKRSQLHTFTPVQWAMVVLIIIGAYFLGSLLSKLQLLKNGSGAIIPQPNTQAANPQPTQKPLTADNVPKLAAGEWIKGDPKSPIALIEYSDHECPFCKQFHPTAQKIVDDYKGKVMWVYRYYPLSFHQNAEKEAEAAECAGTLGGNDAFWKLTDTIFQRTTSNGTGFALDALGPLAKEIGLDQNKFKDCLDSGKMAQKVQSEEDGGVKAGVSGTPGNILLNVKTGETQLLPGAVPYETLKASIDQMLKKV